jgi:hypothetical protein
MRNILNGETLCNKFYHLRGIDFGLKNKNYQIIQPVSASNKVLVLGMTMTS